MNSLGLPQGFEVFHEVRDMDDLDDISLGSAGDISLLTMNEDENENSDRDKEDPIKPSVTEDVHGSERSGIDVRSSIEETKSDDAPEPRMVSHDSMATVRAANVQNLTKPETKSNKKTPWDSLKSLVENKRKSRGGELLAHNNATSGGGMVSRPSTFLREALYGSNVRQVAPQANQEFDQEPASKKPKVEDREVQNHVLHKACMKRGAEAEVIAAILKIDENLAGMSHQIFQVKDVYDCASYKTRSTKVKEKYCYPLNIAIRNRVQYAAIELLVKAAPQVSSMEDGPMREGSLTILLKNSPQDSRLADLLLLSNPTCATLVDKHQNTPLHIACQFGASLAIVKHICILNPQGIRMQNKFGLTPIQVAQRSVRSHHLSSYLYAKQKGIF